MSDRRTAPAFSLIELMTLIGLLAFGATCLVPAWARTRPNGRSVSCLNNLRQLSNAWRLYAEDNGGSLVWNRDGGAVGSGPSQNWVGGWLDFSSFSDNTNTGKLVDHATYPAAAYLGPYVKSAAVFKCPADQSTVRIGSQRLARARSVSMNNFVGAANRAWSLGSQFQLYRRIDVLGKPTPAALWIILDEREESINDGCFFTDPDTAWSLIDYPAAYHSRGAGFAFADGHAEIRHWVDPRTAPVLVPGQQPPFNVVFPGDVDLAWLQQHATSRP